MRRSARRFFSRERVIPANGEFFRLTSLGVGGCALWLRSDTGITKDGSNGVSTWADRSGCGRDASQGTAGLRPIFDESKTINGFPTIHFLDEEAATRKLTFSSAKFVAVTLFIVGAVDPDSYNYKVCELNGFGKYAGASEQVVVAVGGDGETQANGITPGDFSLSELFYDSSTDGFQLWSNGVLLREGTQDLFGHTQFDIAGGMSKDWDVGYGGGWIAEVILYDHLLSSANRQIVENYKNARYGS